MAAVTAAGLALAGCSGNVGEEIEYVPPQTERYTNHMEIEGQWGANAATGEDGQYGIGDPFVMRWNGKYYLYPSTSDPCDGIKVFESEDLIHWQDMGYAVAQSEPTTHGAYAPEVVYYNGYFYLCQSRAGQGHYIYRSKSPVSGFELVSKSETGEAGELDYGNLGMGIDGSFYVSDDGKLYLLHTSTPAGLKFNEITNVDDIRPDTVGQAGVLGEANLHHWIEGPGIFRRGDFSYLTYTGNHVLSTGYRVAYSYAENLNGLTSFIQPVDNVTIIDTDEDHCGLGHSSNVNGPDLDSVYTAYHSLVGRGPARRYNLDRYFAFGGMLTANGVTHRPVAVPAQPNAKANGEEEMTSEGAGCVLGDTGAFFTAEYNCVPVAGQELFFGKNGNGRFALKFTENGLMLSRVTASGETLIAAGNAVYAADALNCVRVENGDGVGYVYLNGMRVISYEAEEAAGTLGYALAADVGFTAFTNDVFGTSDFEAVKNFPTKFPAVTYLKGEMRGFSVAGAKRVEGGVRVGEKQSVSRIGDEYAVQLKKRDWIKYAVDVPEDGTYFLAAKVSKASAGAKLKITVGGSETVCTVPETGAGEGDTVKVSLGKIRAERGVTTMRVEAVSGSAGLLSFEVYESAEEEGNVELSAFTAERGDVAYSNGVLTVTGDDGDGVALWGGAGDFETELTFRCNAGAGTDMGFMFRASGYSYFSAQPAQSWRGYYLKIGAQTVTLYRYDYGAETLDAARVPGLGDGASHTVKIRARSGSFVVFIDGKELFTAQDGCAFLNGKLGVYASSGKIELLKIAYKNL